MSDIAIRCDGIGKQYRIGQRESYKALRDVITDAVKSPFRRLRQVASKEDIEANGKPTIWALHDVSFEVRQGQVVGIIGRNGAGKSTLLKILSRITEPTRGYAEIHGRVGSLLEVGTGFHPELTGRENISLNGAILGMKKAEIARKFDDIVCFAEVEKFIDTPVKHYSSGMYMRLAFAVAAHLEPEILVIDEVLAVGDVAFQKKCLQKMGDVAHQGRTVVFVSHNIAAVSQLTQRTMLLRQGRVQIFGDTEESIRQYLIDADDRDTDVYIVGRHGRRLEGYPRCVEFVSFELREHTNKMLAADSDLVVWVTIKGLTKVGDFRLSIVVFKLDGAPVGGAFGRDSLSIDEGEDVTFQMRLKNTRLAPGSYVCGFGMGKGRPETGLSEFDVVLNVVHFQILAPVQKQGLVTAWEATWGNIRFPTPECERVSVPSRLRFAAQELRVGDRTS
jgi:lipopolysaccharide transport system ATP-binding protein